jgi:uncharacterized surface protein with fasciclin (FAS1) repeats
MRKAMLLAVGMVGLFAVAMAAPAVAMPPGPNLVEVAIAVNSEGMYAGVFDTLIAAVLAADPAVLKTLSGRGQFTVFAPTDDAFAALGLNPDNIGDLDQKVLTDILLYHVFRGRVYAEEVVMKDQIRTLYGTFLYVDGAMLIDALGRTANIIVTDVEASNGIIHVIDAVVLPYNPAA